MDFNLIKNFILRVKVYFGCGKNSELGRGGDGGEVFIAARKIIDSGEGPMVKVGGGDGLVGGRGGKVTIISEEIQSKNKDGMVDAGGGRSIK